MHAKVCYDVVVHACINALQPDATVCHLLVDHLLFACLDQHAGGYWKCIKVLQPAQVDA